MHSKLVQLTVLTIASIAVTAYSGTCIAPSSGLVAWWPGDGDAKDFAGSNHGTLVNGATFAPGLVGQAFHFDGDDDVVRLSNSPELQPVSITVETWIKGTSPNAYQYALSKTFSGGNPSYAIYTGGDRTLYFFVTVGANTIVASPSGGPGVWDGDYHHVVGTYDGNFVRLYVDGVLVGGGTPANGIIQYGNSSENELFIGNLQAASTPYALRADIDEISVYNRALSGAEIAALHAVGSAGKCKPQCVSPPSGLVSWWPGEGDAKDIAGTNQGRLTNGVSFANGLVGQAFIFTQESSYVRLPDVTHGAAEGTVQLWFNISEWNPPQLPAAGLYFWAATQFLPGVSLGDGMNLGTHPAASSTGELIFGIYHNGWNWALSGFVPQPFTWYHVAATWGTNGIRIFVNGVLRGTHPYTGPAPSYTAQSLIGRGTYPGTNIRGMVDELSIFDRALSTNEIYSLYAARKAGMCKPQCVSQPSGLVGWWTGDGNANDLLGRNTGSLQGNAGFASAMVAQGFRFPGGTDYVAIADSPILQVQEHTLSAWVRIDALTGDYQSIISKAYDTNHSFAIFLDSSNRVRMSLFTSLGTVSLIGAAAPVGAFFHIVGTWDGASARLFLDGQQTASSSNFAAVVLYDSNPLLLGMAHDSRGYVSPLNGIVDEFQIVNRALSSDEIAALYAAGSVGMCKSPYTTPSEVSGLALWQDAGSLSLPDGGTVLFWPSSGGLAYGASQTNTAKQPKLHTNGINGRPIVRFLGDYAGQSLRVMANATSQAKYEDLGIGSAGITYFAVVRATYAEGGPLFGDQNAIAAFGGSTTSMGLGRHPFDGTVRVPGDYRQFVRIAGTFSNLDPYVTNETTFYVNGVASPTTSRTNSSAPATGERLNIAADVTDNSNRPHFGGELAELIIYNRRLNPTELQQIDAYLQNKYPATIPQCVQPPTGMVSWWPGEANPNDVLELNNGMLRNGVSFAAGKVGQAFSFDGTSGFVEMTDTPTLFYPRTNSFSISAWIKTSNTITGQVIVHRSGTPGGGSGSFCYLYMPDNVPGANAGHLASALRDTDAGGPGGNDAGGQFLQGPTLVADGNWHHVAMVRDITSLQLILYLDGRLETNAPLNPGSMGDIKNDDGLPDPLLIGAERRPGDTTGHYFRGAIDEASIFNRALSSTEIAAMYTAGSAGMCRGPSRNNLLINGGFEVPVVSPSPGVYRKSNELTGWTVTASSRGVSQFTAAYRPPGGGEQAIQIESAGDSISQMFSTVVGQRYQLTFDLSSFDAGGGVLAVSVGPASETFTGSSNGYVKYSLDFIAISATTTLTLRNSGVFAVSFPHIDNVAIVAASSTNNSCISPPPGLVAWWAGDANATDLVGGNHGYLTNGSSFASGFIGGAFSFDGLDDGVLVPHSPGQDIQNEISISAWVLKRGSGRGNAIVAMKSSVGQGCPGSLRYGLVIYDDPSNGTNNGKAILGLNTVSWSDVVVSKSVIPDNHWTYIAGIYDGAMARIYVNGVLENSVPKAGPLLPSNGPLEIGRQTVCSEENFYGLIDELSLYNRALSSNEIAALYAAGSAGMCRPSVPASIVEQPTNVTSYVSFPVAFRVRAVGEPPLRYQWRFNGSALTGQTNDTLVFSSIQPAQAGGYDVIVSNPLGVVTSLVATLTVRVDIADLAIQNLSVPPNIIAGQGVPVVFTLTNQGTGIASTPWQNAIFLTTNAAGDGAQSIGPLAQLSSLAAGASLTLTQTVLLPSGILGPRFIGLTVNSDSQVFELNRSNNTRVSSTPVVITAPDLEVILFTSAATGVFGQPLNVTWVIRNSGTTTASASWSDRLYLSASSNNLVSTDVLLTPPALRTLAPGESYTNSQTATLPLNATRTPGSYFLVMTTDSGGVQSESNEGNNSSFRPITLTYPPRPDLVVTNIVAPSNGTSGVPVALTWTIANQGMATSTGVWSETVSLSNVVSGLQTLGVFTFTNQLGIGDVANRTQSVTLPLSGPAEQVRFLVEVDSQREILEESETNNLGFAGTVTIVPLQLKLQLSALQIREDTANPIVRATLTRNGPVTQPLTVVLANGDATELRVTNSVTIAAGSSTAPVDLQVLADGVVDGPQTVTISASAAGYQGDSAQVTVLDSDLPRLTLTLTTNVVREGTALAATLTRALVTSNSIIVQIQSSRPAQVSVPATVEIPGGSNAISFVLLASDDDLVEPPSDYTITASAPGFANGAVNLAILDDDLPNVTVMLANHTVSEGAGPQATSVTISRDVVTQRQLVLDVVSSDPTAALVPSRVGIPGGQASVSFPIAAVDDGVVDGPQTTTIRAFVLASGSTTRLTEGTPDVLTVTDDDGPALRLVVNQKIVREGLNPATTATASRNTPATNNLVVMVTSSRTNEATAPASVIISNGQPSVIFDIASLSDSANDGSQTVIITASSPGYASAADTLLVTDTDLPDLTVSSVTTPVSGETESFATITYRVTNQGLVNTPSDFLTRVFLSSDSVVGDDIPISAYRFESTLPVGQHFEQSLQVRLPQSEGNYWAVVLVDTEQRVSEGLENNNTAISSLPIAVSASYAATVHTDVDAVLTGTPVLMRGRATNNLGVPVDSKPVSIHIRVRGTERVISAITDVGGNFETTWQPLPGEAGTYEIFATHPGVAQAPVQDTFAILGMRASPSSTSLLMVERSSVVGTVRLDNLSDVPLTELTATVISKPADLTVTSSLSNPTLPGLGAVTLGYVFTANTEFAYGTVHVRVTSAEGVTTDIYFGVSVEALRPRLVVTPASLSGGMVRGRQRTVEFEVANGGGIPTGPITVSLPGVPWMQLASTNPMPSLAPGETNRVTLLLAPANDLALGPYTGSLALNAAQAGISVPFNFRAISEAKGDLLVRAEDEYTYYAEGAPRVAGATVVVRDGVTQAQVATGVTDTNGVFFAAQLMEGFYELEVTADRHSSYRQNVLLAPGQTNEVLAFLSRQTVQYVWTVEPVEIEDRYEIRIDTTFETVVPVPVVVVEPALVDLSRITGDSAQIDFKISNHGLIDAREFTFTFESHPLWEIKPFLTDVGILPARSTLTVPVTIRRLQPGGGGAGGTIHAATAGGGGPCVISGNGCWTLPCGLLKNSYCSQVAAINPSPSCTPTPSGGGPGSPTPPTPNPPSGSSSGGGGSGSGTPFVSGPVVVSPPQCDCFIPICLNGKGSINASALAQKLSAALTKFFPQWSVKDTTINLSANGDLCACCKDGQIDYELHATATANVSITLIAGPNFSGELEPNDVPGWDDVSFSANGLLGVEVKITGTVQLQLDKDCKGEWKLCGSGSLSAQPFAGAQISGMASAVNQLNGLTYSGSIDGQLGMQGSLTATLSDCSNGKSSFQVCGKVTALAHLNGTLEAGDNMAPFALGADTVVAEAGCNPSPAPAAILVGAIANATSPSEIFDMREFVQPDTEIRRMLNITNRAPAGICTQVKIRLEQQAVVSRDAFKATLEIINSTATPLTAVDVDVVVRDSSGQDFTRLFAVREPTLTGLTGVDGMGQIEGSATGRASWLIIPTQDAAPETPTAYSVSGTLRYVHDGLPVTVPLAAVAITVLPNPRLHVKYFHERDVFSDDPFTEVVELSVPFNLAVMVENRGKGTARNFRITSAQPQIVENERGLLVDFRIIATEVAGQSVTPSLTVNLGTIDPGQNAIGRWLLTSTIQGHFTDYNATFEHIDGLGNAKLSLIEDLSIHEMIHLVRAAGSFEDGKPDFLVNDENIDARDLPDTLYLSDGSTNRVQVIEQSSVPVLPSPGNLTVQLTAPMPAGWAYLRVPEPSGSQLRLSRVRRSDGAEISFGTNVWTTDRTFIGMGRQPLRENVLHLLDYNSAGSYTLMYSLPPQPDTNAPTSTIAALPDNSYEQIPVNWSGADEANGSGLAFFDVFVSTDGGSFVPWLPRTTLRGAVYTGSLGHRYAFYSVATDSAGNREQPPAAPDAETQVSLANRPPTIVLPGTLTVDEGQGVVITNSTIDPDVPANVMTFILLPGAPSGAIINPNTGTVTWQTGEAHGPSTNYFTLRVTDNGQPSLSATGRVTVVVNEVNSPPSLGVITNRTTSEGRFVTFTANANDSDLPTQPLIFSLGAGAPLGADISAASGVFSWRPTEFQGGTTNRISVIVRDTGTPSLGATQTFSIIVRDTQGDFILALGSTNVFIGETNSVPLTLRVGTELSDVSFLLGANSERLGALSLGAIAPEIVSSTLQPSGSNQSRVQLTARAGDELIGSMTLAQLNFTALSNHPSTIVPLRFEDAQARQPNGNLLARPKTADGRVFIIGEEPILDSVLETNGAMALTLYGRPERHYTIETNMNLASAAGWRAWEEIDLFSPWLALPDVPPTGPMVFYRAATTGREFARLVARREAEQLVIEWSASAGSCELLESSSLDATAVWSSSVTSAQLIDGRYRMSVRIASGGTKFYRLRCMQ
jgi:hypothetical protein